MNIRGIRKRMYFLTLLMSLFIAYSPTVYAHFFNLLSGPKQWIEYDKLVIDSPQKKASNFITVSSHAQTKISVRVRYNDKLLCKFPSVSYDNWIKIRASNIDEDVRNVSDYRITGYQWRFNIKLPQIDAVCKVQSTISIYPPHCFGCVKKEIVESNIFIVE